MRRSTIFLSAAAVLVLSAGIVVGNLSAHLRALKAVEKPMDHGREWFQDTLGLTAEQHQKMDGIWADVRQQMDKNGEHRHALDKDRDAAIRALLTTEQLVAYDKIFQDYRTHRAELDKDREACFRSGNDRSRALLTPEQQTKWDAMSKDMHDQHHRGPGGPGGLGGPGGRGRGGPSTRPMSTTGPVGTTRGSMPIFFSGGPQGQVPQDGTCNEID